MKMISGSSFSLCRLIIAYHVQPSIAQMHLGNRQHQQLIWRSNKGRKCY